MRTLFTRLGRIRRALVWADAAATLAQALFWVALIAYPAAIVLRARRRNTHTALPGVGDDTPAGYEIPAESAPRDASILPDPLASESENAS
jgi:hypothetical protein